MVEYCDTPHIEREEKQGTQSIPKEGSYGVYSTNMLDWWVVLVKDFGAHSTIPQIQELSNIIRRKIKEGKWIRSSYKASFFNKDDYKNIEKFDVILCWHNDWPEAEKEIIEIKNTVRIHESWN